MVFSRERGIPLLQDQNSNKERAENKEREITPKKVFTA